MFQRGGVDAIEWSGIDEDLKMGFDKIAEYATVPAPHSRGGCFELAWKVQTWDALPQDLRDKIKAIAKLATFDTMLEWKKNETDALKRLRASDIKIVKPTPELVDEVTQDAKDYTYRRVAEQGDDNPWLKKIADSYYAAMKEYNSSRDVITP